MATSATPSGAEPVDTLSASGSFTGKVRHIKVANAYNTAIFYGKEKEFYPASTAADDIMAYVVDDPKLLFRMQADEAIAQTGLGNNVSAVSTAGSTSIGRSRNALDGGSVATTNTLPLRVVDFVDGPTSTVGDAFTDCIVTYLPLSHAYETKLGV